MNRFTTAAASVAFLTGCVSVHVYEESVGIGEWSEREDWREAEQGILANHVQLTFPDRFVKAGEAYVSPGGAQIIFQAIETPPEGEAADEFYAMFVADIAVDGRGRPTGLANVMKISPPGSANTCGWFHPGDPGRVLFASTIGPPTESHPPGYQRSTGRYRWMFPSQMTIVGCHLPTANAAVNDLVELVGNEGAYLAEGSWSPDGRHLLYCSLQSNEGDLFVLDTASATPRPRRIVSAGGYDGGPFFSPDGRRICYRSDRRGDHRLQLYVADLAFDEAGSIVGIEREYQLTDNEHVNWCPFWHPGGRHLVYATSEMGHHNYEVFLIDADPGTLDGSGGSIKYGTRKRRVTYASRADVLPAFDSDGSRMVWTSRRGASGSVQLWMADFVMDLDAR